MAIGYNQTICNARDLAATLNDIVDAVDEGFQLADRPNVMRLEHNDDLLVSWVEGGDPAYYTLYLLDGSDDEDWVTMATSPSGEYRMRYNGELLPTYGDFVLPEQSSDGLPAAAYGIVRSNHFPEGWKVDTTDHNHPYYKDVAIMLHQTTPMLQMYHPDYQTVDAWRAYLSAHPLIVFVKIPE